MLPSRFHNFEHVVRQGIGHLHVANLFLEREHVGGIGKRLDKALTGRVRECHLLAAQLLDRGAVDLRIGQQRLRTLARR